jgi:hypothetical protein
VRQLAPLRVPAAAPDPEPLPVRMRPSSSTS